MFDNLVSRDDFPRLAHKIRQSGASAIARRLLGVLGNTRVASAWQHTSYPLKTWGSLPAVKARWNRLATGDPETTVHEYVVTKYLNDKPFKALSIGCGTGAQEIRWARTGRFQNIHAIDISSDRIAQARLNAADSGFRDVINFQVGDVREIVAEDAAYDIILAMNALHHVSPLATSIRRLADTLKPGGLFVLWDYVGPSRFRWTDQQLAQVESALSGLPTELKRRWGTNQVKKRQWRPGTLSMLLSDPSEAAESNNILTKLDEQFALVERRDLGGALTHLVLDDIAHNFEPPSEESDNWLQFLFDSEDRAMDADEIPSDFVFAVYQKE